MMFLATRCTANSRCQGSSQTSVSAAAQHDHIFFEAVTPKQPEIPPLPDFLPV